MSGDYSRRRFDPRKHYASVLMQQGRVQLDADWNELAELFERRFRAERVDTFGRVAVPRVGPGDANNTLAFRLSFQAGQLALGRGRMYVDGLLVENHGRPGAAVFDPVLDELHGADDLPLTEQPYFPPGAALPPPDRPFAVYLDVWRREVTALEDPDLVEPALGVDTTTRTQVAWQARFFAHPSLTASTDAATIEALPEYQALTRPSGARLTVTTGAPEPGVVDPCILPPGGGFRSLENHLYRVEIHRGGPQAGATFKWSRDNATVATAVVAVDGDALTVESLGRDAVLRIRKGDWVELTDDLLEAARVPGLMAKVADTDDEERTLVLHAPLADLVAARPDVLALGEGAFPNLDPAAARHTRVRRWDQAGRVTVDGAEIDLTDPASGGVLPVPAPGSFVALESGIQLAFDTDGGLDFRPFDAWTFAARAADGSVEPRTQAPPEGDHHHYALLGLVTQASETVSDLRVLWPPQADGGGGCCTLHVTPEQHNGGTFTIQAALDALRTTGGAVCLDAGVYRITDAALRLDGARGVALRGQGPQTVLARQVVGEFDPDPKPDDKAPDFEALKALSLVHVTHGVGVTLQDLTLLGSADLGPLGPFIALVRVSTCAGLTIERCTFLSSGESIGGPGLVVRGALVGATIRDNVFLTGSGVIEEFEKLGAELFTVDLRIERNLFQSEIGLDIRRHWFFSGATRIAGNRFVGAHGLQVHGTAADGALVIADNHLDVRGTGVDSAASRLVITGNTFVGAQLRPDQEGGGGPLPVQPADNVAVKIDRRNDPVAPDTLTIAGNTIRHFTRGIAVLEAPYARIEIRDNRLETLREHGIFVGAFENLVANRCTYGEVTVEGNDLRDLGGADDPAYLVGVGVHTARLARVERNTIDGLGLPQDPPGRPWNTQVAALRGISIVGCLDAVVRGNRLLDCGPATVAQKIEGDIVVPPFVVVTAIQLSAIFQRLECVDNHVARRDHRGATHETCALRVDDERQGRLQTVQDDKQRRWILFPDAILQETCAPSYLVAGNHLQAVLRPNDEGFFNPIDPAARYPLVIQCDGLVTLTSNHLTIHNLGSVSPVISHVRARAGQVIGNAWIMSRPTEAASARFDITAPVALGNLFFHCTSSAPFAVPGLLNLDVLGDRNVL